MKKWIALGVVAVLALTLILSCPSTEDHREAMKEILKESLNQSDNLLISMLGGYVLDAVADAMRAKAELPIDRAFMLAVLGGAYIALAAFGSTVIACDFSASPETYGLGRCLSGLLFPVGLMLVILGGAELFT